MSSSVKALMIVLAIAASIFHLAKPIVLQFTRSEDFSRRQLLWVLLTVVGFISPNFWLYVLVAVPAVLWANRLDSNPAALYLLLLHVIPPVGIPIPILGNNGLFPLNNYRLLALCILLPALLRYRKNKEKTTASKIRIMDFLLLAYGALEVLFYTAPDLPHHDYTPDSVSNGLRRFVLFFLDTYLLYFIVSRTVQSRKRMLDMIATFCLVCGVMAAIALFEHLRDWLLYVDIMTHWQNNPNAGFYLTRGGSVRAQVSAGHSIALGNLLTVGFGFWLYLKSRVSSAKYRLWGTLLLCGGLYATTSRGSWLGAATVYFTFLAAGPRAVARLIKGIGLALVTAGLVVISPIGNQLLEMLPKPGQPADLYRHHLAERGWDIVLAHPLFGDHFPWPEMDDLRQGEGIIDIVNSYLGIGLTYGLSGLFLFLSFILLGMVSVYWCTKTLTHSDPDLALFGTSLIACITGILVMIDSASFNLGIQVIFYVLAGLTVAFTRLVRAEQFPPGYGVSSKTLQD